MTYFRPRLTSLVKLFCKHSEELKDAYYFRKKAP